MTTAQPTSRARFRDFRRDMKAHETEGTKRTAVAHAKTKDKSSHRSFIQLFKAFWGILRGFRGAVIIALLTVTVSTVLRLVPPYASKLVLDNVLGGLALPPLLERFNLPVEPRSLLAVIGISLVVIAIIQISVGMTGRWLATRTTKQVQSKVRRLLFGHAARLPLHRVYELKSGGVASILREDGGGVGELVFSMLYNPWRSIVQLIGSIIMLAFIDWKLLLGSIAILPIVFLSLRTWIGRIRPLWHDIRMSRSHVDGHATEAFGGMRVVRGFGRQRAETNRFIRNNHLMIRQELLAWWWSRTIDIAWALIIPLATAALLWYGGTRVLDGALTTGDLIVFLLYLAWLLEPLAVLATSATSFQNQLAGLDRVLDLMEEPQEAVDHSGTMLVDRDKVQGAISMENVTFVYPGSDRTVIDDVTLEIGAGETVALVGTSGAGKTTLTNLIARFYDPTNGVIRLDGRDVREIDLESYRRLLGIVEQDIFLFDGTVLENIGYGRRGASRAEIEGAARLANADDFINELDDGYDTIIGERGVKLSGGQRQRVAIARAILGDPRILILDEATSNLDTESERLIQKSLAHLLGGRTSFVIAHRLSTITTADRIVVLEDGRIVETGTHDELMSRDTQYAAMVRLQGVVT